MEADKLVPEIVKLAVQFLGALFIAWVAVRLALSRYKKEKHWERKLAAYSDLVSALGAMSRINDEWEMDALGVRHLSDESSQRLRKRYWDARQRLEETSAVAQLLLPSRVAEAITELERELGRSKQSGDWVEQIEKEWKVIEAANRKIIEIGRKDLELPSSD